MRRRPSGDAEERGRRLAARLRALALPCPVHGAPAWEPCRIDTDAVCAERGRAAKQGSAR